MTPETPLAPGLYRLTSNLDDEVYGPWPIPHGLAIHAYLVRGAQTVVIDPYHEGDYGADEVAEDLEVLGLGWGDIDAVTFTGADPGLTWPVPVASDAQLAQMGLSRLQGMLFHAPTKTLFSGVHWAGFGAVEDTVLSTEANGTEARFYEDEALRWWVTHPSPVSSAEVVAPPGTTLIAPAHGLLWPNPAAVVERTEAWKRWSGPAEDEVVVVWSDDPAEDATVFELLSALQKPGLDLTIFRVPDDHDSFIRAALRRASGVVLGPGAEGPGSEGNLLAGLAKVVWRPLPIEDLTSGAALLLRGLGL